MTVRLLRRPERRTNTARSMGPSVSRTSSIAIETFSANSTSSATSGVVSSGAMITHLRYDEARCVAVNLVYLALAAFVAWGRLGPEPFTG